MKEMPRSISKALQLFKKNYEKDILSFSCRRDIGEMSRSISKPLIPKKIIKNILSSQGIFIKTTTF